MGHLFGEYTLDWGNGQTNRFHLPGHPRGTGFHLCIKGWIAHARHGDTWRLRRSLLAAPVPKRTP